jgi:tetratricopeptide (TPR) repeat protein
MERLAALIAHAEQLAVTGSAEEAERINLEILERAPDDLGALNRLGKISKDRGDHDAAIAYYRRTLELAPDNRIAKAQLDRLRGGPVRSVPERVNPSAIRRLMETIACDVSLTEPIACGPVDVHWPSERGRLSTVEHYPGGWDVEATLGGRNHSLRHLLGYRVAYGRLRRRSLTMVHGNVETEGVEADDYARTRGLLSVLRHPGGTHVRSKSELPDGYAGFPVVWHHDEILAPGSPESLAVKLLEDDIVGWTSHALLRAAGRGRLAP